jgi:hypothetical protein
MVDNKLIQRAILNKLKADTTLIAWMTVYDAENEIKEFNWQSSNFIYPNIRISLGTQTENGNPPCFSELAFTIYCNMEGDSSALTDELAYIVNKALLRKNLLPTAGDGFTTGIVSSGGTIKAARLSERIWQAVNSYNVQIYGGF